MKSKQRVSEDDACVGMKAVFGRVANQAVQTVCSISTLGVGCHKLPVRKMDALTVERSSPKFPAPYYRLAVVMFTDGACEGAERME